jgi:syringate O-demethylase
VAVNYDGYVIGDNILFHLEEDEFQAVGIPPSINWLHYHAATGGYDVRVWRDDNSLYRKGDPVLYRYQVQGPGAMNIIREATGQETPQLRFFHMTRLKIAGKPVRALRHGMAGEPGLELWGPWADNDAVHSALLEAGRKHGMVQVGGRAYHTNALESGWLPRPLPAVYSGEKMKPYREWLTHTAYETTSPLGGSFYSDNIEDYYFTPYELDYGRIVSFDHDFIGREALERRSGDPHRKKVTLALDTEDVMRVIGTQFQKDHRAKFIEFPSAVYSMHPYDKVTKNGKTIGISTWVGYSANEGRMLTLAVLDAEHATMGNEVIFVWGEENGGTSKPAVERHDQVEMRAIVSPVPYSEVARREYVEGGWRTAAR